MEQIKTEAEIQSKWKSKVKWETMWDKFKRNLILTSLRVITCVSNKIKIINF